MHALLYANELLARFRLAFSRYLTSFGSCYCKKQIDISFLCVSPVIEDKFRHNIVKVFNLSSTLGLARAALYYYDDILIFSLNLIITIIVILLAYSTVCSDLIIVLHQARRLLPIVD